MTCSACASSIEQSLARLEGVKSARVNFTTSKATVMHHNNVTTEDLRAAINALGFSTPQELDRDAADAIRQADLWLRFRLAAALTLVLAAISMITPLRFAGWEWLGLVLATPVVLWSGWCFHRVAAINLRHRLVTMDTLVSVGSLAAWVWSLVVLLAGIDAAVYFETSAVIITLILLGKWLEVRATRRSGEAIRALADLGARTAQLEDGSEIAVEDLAIGMRFRVRPGEKIATDGVVVDGHSAVDVSMLTGESTPIEVGARDEVFGASLNTNGWLLIETTRVGEETALAQIIRLVDKAQENRAQVQRLADRVARVFVPTALVISMATLLVWLFLGEPINEAFTASVAVLIIACPCALGLATPLAIMVGTGRGAQLGIIIKGAEVLEDTRKIDTVLLDKTGTITSGAMELVAVVAADGDEKRWLEYAAALESRSEHPVATAIAAECESTKEVQDFQNRPGLGVLAKVDNTEIAVGRAELFTTVAPQLEQTVSKYENAGHTVVYVGSPHTASAVIAVADKIRPTSPKAVAALKAQKLQVVLLTGDNERTARAVAQQVGIDQVHAETFPDSKVAEVVGLQKQGMRVAMVGDGINDAPALAQADVGIAIGDGTDVAMEASDITILRDDLLAVADSIALARRTLSTIKGNLFWAFAYNTAAIPLAAFGILNPMIAAASMGLSSLFVVSNSLRLRRFSPQN